MLKTKAAMQVVDGERLPEDTILLGEAYARSRKIPQGQHIVLKFGAFRQHVKVIPAARFDGIRISRALADKMGLREENPRQLHLRMQYRASTGTLALGPLIAVLVSRDYPHMPERPFGSITMFCKELAEACRLQGAYVYFVTPKDLRGGALEITGWTHSESGWLRNALPLPDIINNRLTSRKLENSPRVQNFIKQARQLNRTYVFNEKFLDKTEVFEALRKDETLHKLLPESHPLRGYATLKAMCAKYPVVFLKPVRGSLGKGIIRVSRAENNGYMAQYAAPTGTRRQLYPSLAKLYAHLSSKVKSVKYQAQQGLQLIEVGKRPVDFRALVQKNGSGEWMITSIVARTAGSQHFVSNLARGGTLSKVSAAVEKSNLAGGTKRLESAKKLRGAALLIARGIEEHIPAHFGELGIDLALDTSGRVWLIEVNSKPSKNDNTPLSEGKIRPSVRMMILYARYLTGF